MSLKNDCEEVIAEFDGDKTPSMYGIALEILRLRKTVQKFQEKECMKRIMQQRIV